jgi:hypothetical protein
MDNDQARKLVALHDNADRALLNLRNANGMATDDPRAPELLSEAGDAYAEAYLELLTAQMILIPNAPLKVAGDVGEAPTADYPEGFEPGKAAWIVQDGEGAGFIADPSECPPVDRGHVVLRLTTGATFHGESYAEGEFLTLLPSALSLEAPAEG